MNRKRILVGIVVAAVVLALVVPVVAAGTNSRNDELNALVKQLHDLQKQIIQKEADLGFISPDQAKWQIQQIDQADAWRAQNPNAVGPRAGYGPGYGPVGGGYGCPMYGGAGWGGMMGGAWGRGGGGMMGGWWGGYGAPAPNTAPGANGNGNI